MGAESDKSSSYFLNRTMARPAEVSLGFCGKKRTCMAKAKKLHCQCVLKPPAAYDRQQRSAGNHARCLLSPLWK